MCEDFAEAVYEVAAVIPRGSVLSYGDIAELLECAGPRQVGAAMSRAGEGTPWWRVVRASGLPPAGHSIRASPFYEAEGTPLRAVGHTRNDTSPDDGYTIDMGAARWNPTAEQRVVLDAIRSQLAEVSGFPRRMSEPHDGLQA
ncbi:MGMT family protein [Arthrobacter sp. Hz1]